ncbi:carotenoid oxygenase [Lasiosphaeria miniovina]|uniref:Carotenoid oxygenase n=1 Tax=Lasiosphaeria miniovina TaxID=1954250 RepID=A0AA40BEU6_9PEZI|nr:carotenoid oxygenase [Lasiosphaeria miniovina]KAK0732894.1 carotenoid oxygenase [Lasiosphaeria miniovina]
MKHDDLRSAFKRTEVDEKADFQESLNNFVGGAYTEWPNEAGFDGLTEERGPIEVPVAGQIPSWAAGSLFRTGPGIYKIEGTSVGTFYTSHWFDGLAHTHRFDIVSGDQGPVKVFYSSRRQSEQMMEHIKENGGRKYYSFGQRSDPCLGLFSKIMSSWQAARVPQDEKWIENINVVVHPDLPGLDAAAGNLVDTGKAQARLPTGKTAVTITAGGHRAATLKNLWIATDNAMLKQVDPESLEPIGFTTQKTLHPDLKGPLSCAHAQRDPDTGDLFNWNQEFGRQTVYRIFRVKAATGETDVMATIQGPGVKAAYIHSFYLTPSFVVLCIPSSHVGLGGIKIAWERNVIDAIEPFDSHKKCKWFVVDRLHGKGVVASFETDAGFFFHTVNAFEEQDVVDVRDGTTSLFCDVIEYASLDVMSSLYYDVLLQKDKAAEKFWSNDQRARDTMTHMARYHFRVPSPTEETKMDGATPSQAVAKQLDIPAPHCGELPTINPNFATRRHRYVYSLPYWGRSTSMDGIVKTDTLTREALFWDIPPGHSPGEAIFVPRPGGTDEDDGVLLSVVLNGNTRTSFLLCLDAKTMVEAGRAEVGFAVAFGFHGTHVAA